MIGVGPIPAVPPSPDTPKPPGSQEPTRQQLAETPGSLDCPGFFFVAVKMRLIPLPEPSRHKPLLSATG
jgi:hypothetical protein